MASFSGTVRCTRCLEEVGYLLDPRLLPCSHIYCTECLETISNTVESGLELQCFQCGKTHEMSELSSLAVVQEDETCQKVELNNLDVPGTEESSDVTEDEEQENEAGQLKKCARCTDRKAVCFCIDCGERYCKIHEELHNNWYGNRHKFLSMDIYLTKPNLYVKPICKHHKQEITLACKLCFSLACGRCDTLDGKCDNAGIEKHIFESLRGAEKVLRAQFNEILTRCSEQLTYMGKKEKQTWQCLDLIKDDCEKMKRQVEEKVNKQIVQIRREGDRILQEITAYESRNSSSVETYLQDLRTKREELEGEILRCRQFLRENHVVKMIKHRKEGEEILQRRRLVDTRFDFQIFRLQDNGSAEDCLQMAFTPKALKLNFISEFDIQDNQPQSQSICRDATGKAIYIAGSNRIIKYSQDMAVLASLDTHGWVTSVITDGNNVYYVDYIKPDWNLMKTSRNLTNPIKITTFVKMRQLATHITINKGSVITSQRDIQSIHVYNEETGASNMIPLKFAPRVVSTHQDGDLLITDTDGSLHKCRMKSRDEVEIVWSYSRLQQAYGICTMDNGFIVLAANMRRDLHVISAQGEMIQIFQHDRLREVVGGMCMINNILYLPCWNKGEYLTYELRAEEAEE